MFPQIENLTVAEPDPVIFVQLQLLLLTVGKEAVPLAILVPEADPTRQSIVFAPLFQPPFPVPVRYMFSLPCFPLLAVAVTLPVVSVPDVPVIDAIVTEPRPAWYASVPLKTAEEDANCELPALAVPTALYLCEASTYSIVAPADIGTLFVLSFTLTWTV